MTNVYDANNKIEVRLTNRMSWSFGSHLSVAVPLQYTSSKGAYDAILLPYVGGQYAALAILPAEGVAVNEAIKAYHAVGSEKVPINQVFMPPSPLSDNLWRRMLPRPTGVAQTAQDHRDVAQVQGRNQPGPK